MQTSHTHQEQRRGEPSPAWLQRETAGLYRPRRLLALLAVQAALLAGHVTTSWHASPDSALYRGLARSISEGRGYVFNFETHAMVPPGYPLFLAGWTGLFGGSYLSINLSQVLLAPACTLAAFALLRRLFGPDLALVGAGLFAVDYALFEAASMPISDLLFTLAALAGMLLAVRAADGGPRRWAAALGAAAVIAAATLIRVNGIAAALGAAGAMLLGWPRRGRLERVAAALCVGAVAAGPIAAWKFYIAAAGEDAGPSYAAVSHLAKPPRAMLAAVAGNLGVEVPREMSNLVAGVSDVPPGLSLLVPALAVAGAIICLRRRDAVLPVSLLATMALLCIVPGVRRRYLLFVLPGIFVFAALGITWLARMFAAGRPGGRRARRGLVVAACVFGAVHVGHSAKTLYELRANEVAGGHRFAREQGWFTASRYIARQKPSAGPRPVVFTDEHSLVHYLTRCRTLAMKCSGRQSVEQYVRLLRRHRPEFLLSERSEARTQMAVEAVGRIGARLERVRGLDLSGTITLWRIRYALGEEPTRTTRPGGPATKASAAGGEA